MSNRRPEIERTVIEGLGVLTPHEAELHAALHQLAELYHKQAAPLSAKHTKTPEDNAALDEVIETVRQARDLAGLFHGDEVFDIPLPLVPLSPEHRVSLLPVLRNTREQGGIQALILYKTLGLSWDEIGSRLGTERHLARGMALQTLQRLLALVPRELRQHYRMSAISPLLTERRHDHVEQ